MTSERDKEASECNLIHTRLLHMEDASVLVHPRGGHAAGAVEHLRLASVGVCLVAGEGGRGA